MRKEFCSEFLGTFSMVFIGCIAIKQGYSAPIVSLAFGFAVFLVILTSRRFSGAHINPAVSIAFAISGELDRKLLPVYVIAQLTGALLAAIIIGEYGATEFTITINSGIIIEIFITFILMFGIYLTIWHTNNDAFVAIIVGIIVALLAFYFGQYTGASMNPARTFGPNVVSGNANQIPIYFVSTIIGSILAAFLSKILNKSNQA
ncbi:MAG: MIP/aquaporin family protein [Candidatus Poseidoniaceae archaeon]